MLKGGQSKQKKKRGGAGATHILTHNFVVRNLYNEGAFSLSDRYPFSAKK